MLKINPTPKVRLGIIGGGLDSAVGRAHCSALALDGLYEVLIGCYSRDQERNLLSNRLWKAREVTNDFRSFLSLKEDIDAVLVLTPTPSHFQIVSELLDLGFTVICEKSLTTNSPEALELLKASEKKHPIFVTFNYTGYPMVREMKSRISKNIYGNIHTVHIEMRQDSFTTTDGSGNPKKVQPWRLKDYEIPTVSLDLGVHVVNLFEFLTGESIRDVVAISSHKGIIANVVDNVHALAQSINTTQVIFSYGKTFAGNKNGLKVWIYGEKGSASWSQEFPNEIYEASMTGDIRTLTYSSEGLLEASKPRYSRFKVGHPVGFIEAFSNLYVDIYASLTQNAFDRNFVFGPKEALTGLNTLEGIHTSSQTNQWVSVESLNETLMKGRS